MVSFDGVDEKSLKKLKKHGYSFVDIKTKYELARMKGPCTIVLYRTGKLLLQGKEEEMNTAAKILGFLNISKTSLKKNISMKSKFSGVAVGSDETLKGDTFGGMIVAGFKADDKIRQELVNIGVRDSKTMLKPEIVRIANELMERYPKNFHVESMLPKEYNKYVIKDNVTRLLDDMHVKCFKKLSRGKDAVHIVDLYPGCSVGDIKEKHAESKYPEVAAASIIARCEGLKQIRELEQKAGFFIPLGSTHVESALLEIRKKSLEPSMFVKMNFKNVAEFFSK